MSSKKMSKTNVENTSQNVETVAPVVEKKTRGKKQLEAKIAAPVVPVATVAPVVEKTPAKKGKKAVVQEAGAVVAAVEVPVQEASVDAALVTAVKTPAKRKAKAKAEVVVEAVATEAKQKGGRKKVEKVEKTEEKKKRTPKKAPETVSATGGEVEAELDDEKQIRSFKVKLPGSDQFEGRFTGLTPYQAANKALSKYFREGERVNAEVTFSICESTRKSKKSVYTYVGQRHKLESPVKYTIQDGREIVKNFKNSLKKVKKTETQAEQTVVASSSM